MAGATGLGSSRHAGAAGALCDSIDSICVNDPAVGRGELLAIGSIGGGTGGAALAPPNVPNICVNVPGLFSAEGVGAGCGGAGGAALAPPNVPNN